MLDTVLQACKRRKGNGENIPAIKASNGRYIIDSIYKANSLNSYYASAFGCKQNIAQIKKHSRVNPSPLTLK
jgi:hypothetical protein